MANETFAQARTRILTQFRLIGWTVKADLKTPHATSADGRLRFWFKPQAVYATSGTHHELGNARSLWVDIRGIYDAKLLIDIAQIGTAADQRIS